MTSTTTLATNGPTAAEPTRRRHRITLGTLLTVVVTFIAINGLLGQIGSFRDIGTVLAGADWRWLVGALACCALTFPISALGARAGLGVDLPLGRMTQLQLSSKFANLVTPGGIGSTALNVKFLQHQGVDATTAITADVATGLVSGVAELLVVGLCVWVTGARFDVGELPPGTGRVVLLVVLVIGVIVAVASRVPKVRAAVVPHLRRAWQTIVRLARTPRATLLITGSAIATNLAFAGCLALCLRAYGGALPFATVVLVNWGAATLGSMSPAPGGLGVAEAGLVAGFTAAGIPSDLAVAAALTHRLITFWLPPVAGWVTMRRLRRAELL
jgi:glycosyltransferase 2 family protein